MKRILLSFIAACCLFAMSTAQTNYVFQKTNESYQNLTNSISLNNGTQWDDPIYQFDLGFSFTLFDQPFSTIYLGIEGGADLANMNIDEIDYFTNTIVMFSPLFLDLIDPCYEDDGEPGACSNISYVVEGEPGNRICKLEWNNASIYSFEPEVTLNMQVWFYEGSNILEYRFGNHNITADILEDLLDQEAFLSLIESVNPMTETVRAIVVWGNPDDPTVTVINQSDVDTELEFDMETCHFTSMPASGTVYRFIPEGVGIQSHDNLNITLAPNPVQSNMILTGADGALVQIYDLLGNLLTSEIYNAPISVEGLAAGTYVVKIVTDHGNTTKKMIRE